MKSLLNAAYVYDNGGYINFIVVALSLLGFKLKL